MSFFTPREIVSELDRYIIGQGDAKRAVAIALRNRWRRQLAGPDLRDEVLPKNILMIGPTGVGKTEISRRLGKLAQAPFIKVEATKFTEVGYVGRDVEQIVRDLLEVSLTQVRDRRRHEVEARPKRGPKTACSMRWPAPMRARARAMRFASACVRVSWATRKSNSVAHRAAAYRCSKYRGCQAHRSAC